MRRISPTLRGFAIIFAVAGIITALQLEDALAAIFFVLRIVFIVAIAWLLFTLWRRRREEIAAWQARSRVDYPSGGLEALVFFAVLAACVFACWRVWRDEHTYGY